MTAQSSGQDIRVDDKLKSDVVEKCSRVGLTGELDAYDAWFRAKAHEAQADTRPPVAHQQVMDEAQALIDRKRRART